MGGKHEGEPIHLNEEVRKDIPEVSHLSHLASLCFRTYDDPALYDPELKRKLETNRKLAKSRMDTVSKYDSCMRTS